MKMATCKSLFLLLITIFINFFHLTVQKERVSLSFPLTFRRLSEISASKANLLSSSNKTPFQQKNDVASSPPWKYRLPVKYSMALIASIPVGTPPQVQQMVLDTGSQLSWIQCREMKWPPTASFNHSLSSSFSDMICNRPSDCNFFDSTIWTTCVSHLCRYSYFYADGNPAEGSLVRENFTFSSPLNTPRLILGCTNKTDSSGAQGILGMNLGPTSFISQTRVPKFSYFVPPKINNNNNPSTFYLGDNPNSNSFQFINLSTFSKSQPMPNFDPYAYTVDLMAISIGGKKLNISKEAFLADAGGSGQTIMDSGCQYTFLIDAAYNKVKEHITNLMSSQLIKDYVYEGCLDMCFNGTSSKIGQIIGDLVFEFGNGGVKISIPKERTLDDVHRGVSCFAIAPSDSLGIPSNIIGNFHQQNLWVEFDVENRQIGFGNANCSESV